MSSSVPQSPPRSTANRIMIGPNKKPINGMLKTSAPKIAPATIPNAVFGAVLAILTALQTMKRPISTTFSPARGVALYARIINSLASADQSRLSINAFTFRPERTALQSSRGYLHSIPARLFRNLCRQPDFQRPTAWQRSPYFAWLMVHAGQVPRKLNQKRKLWTSRSEAIATVIPNCSFFACFLAVPAAFSGVVRVCVCRVFETAVGCVSRHAASNACQSVRQVKAGTE